MPIKSIKVLSQVQNTEVKKIDNENFFQGISLELNYYQEDTEKIELIDRKIFFEEICENLQSRTLNLKSRKNESSEESI